MGFRRHTAGHFTLGRASLNEWSSRRRDLLPNDTQHSRGKNIYVPMGFEPTIPESKLPHIHTFDRVATDGLSETHEENLFLEQYLKECESVDTIW